MAVILYLETWLTKETKICKLLANIFVKKIMLFSSNDGVYLINLLQYFALKTEMYTKLNVNCQIMPYIELLLSTLFSYTVCPFSFPFFIEYKEMDKNFRTLSIHKNVWTHSFLKTALCCSIICFSARCR